MNWQFSDSSTLVNVHNGFTIFLIKGSWKSIEDMVPLAPEGMNFLRQAQLLREGVSYAELCADGHYVAHTLPGSEAIHSGQAA
jgi:hypothetical protein